MSKEEVLKNLPDKMKAYIARNDIKFYIINATRIAENLALVQGQIR
jgi:pyruvate-ferredoxin/flavodoxin oxidoreductase